MPAASEEAAMKAAILHAPNQPLTIEEVAVNKPESREVLLRTAFAGLCHSDLHFIEGLYPIATPVVLGHESSAIVEAVGDGVAYVKAGDHVITCLSVFCGTWPQCLTWHPNLCEKPDVKMLDGAALAGAERIIAIDTVASKLELARELGATDTLNVSNTDPVKAVRDMTGGGVHYSFEALGTKATAEQAFQMLRAGGTATIIGMVPFGVKIELHGFDFLRDRKIQGTSMGRNRLRVDMPRLLSLWRQGRLKLDHLISGRSKLAEINDGFAALK